MATPAARTGDMCLPACVGTEPGTHIGLPAHVRLSSVRLPDARRTD